MELNDIIIPADKVCHRENNGIIINANCVDIMQVLPDNCIDLVVTSPPYENLRDYKGYSFDFENIAKELFRIIKEGGVVVWVVGDTTIDQNEVGTPFKQVLYFKEIGFKLFDTMIYEKNGFSYPSINRYHQVWEFMFVLSKGNPKTFNPIKDRKNIWEPWGKNTSRQKDGSLMERKIKRKSYLGQMGMRFNIWRYNVGGCGMSSSDKVAFNHPAIFPEALAGDHIISWSNPNDIVLDCFAGSGTSLKMAKNLCRKFIGIEISADYCKICTERLQQGILPLE